MLVILLATAAILTKLQSIDKEQQYRLAWQEAALARVRHTCPPVCGKCYLSPLLPVAATACVAGAYLGWCRGYDT